MRRYMVVQPRTPFVRRMLKAPPVNPRAKAFSVLKFNCRNYNAIVGAIFQIPKFATLGVLKIRLTQVGPRFV